MIKLLLPILLLSIAALALWFFVIRPNVYPEVKNRLEGTLRPNARESDAPENSQLKGADFDTLCNKRVVFA